MLTLLQFRDAVKAEKQLDPGVVSDAELDRYMNDCLDDLGSFSVLEKTTDLSAAGAPVGLPADFVAPILLRWEEQPDKLYPVEMVPDADAIGTPVAYVIDGSHIYLYPLATGTLHLTYTYSPAHLTAESQSPDIPESWAVLPTLYMTARCHRKNGNYMAEREYMADYEMQRSIRIARELQRMNARKRTVRDTRLDLEETYQDYYGES